MFESRSSSKDEDKVCFLRVPGGRAEAPGWITVACASEKPSKQKGWPRSTRTVYFSVYSSRWSIDASDW